MSFIPATGTHESRRELTPKQQRLAYFKAMQSNLFTTRDTGKEAYTDCVESLARIAEPAIRSECVIALHIMINSFGKELETLENINQRSQL